MKTLLRAAVAIIITLVGTGCLCQKDNSARSGTSVDFPQAEYRLILEQYVLVNINSARLVPRLKNMRYADNAKLHQATEPQRNVLKQDYDAIRAKYTAAMDSLATALAGKADKESTAADLIKVETEFQPLVADFAILVDKYLEATKSFTERQVSSALSAPQGDWIEQLVAGAAKAWVEVKKANDEEHRLTVKAVIAQIQSHQLDPIEF